MKISVYWLIPGVLSLLVGFFLLLSYRNRLKKQMNFILEALDRALKGQKTVTDYNESMDSAITEKLNRLIEISRMNYARADSERNGVKALISNISHQVRTPLTNIMLYAGLLSEQNLTNEQKIMAQKVHKQAEKLDFFMGELVRTSYLETEMISVHPRIQEVAELLGKVCQAEEVHAMKKGITFHLQESKGQAFFDMKWTAEALGNILNNAVKYSPLGSLIEITVKEYESFLRISMKDQGMGIPEKEQGRIFERFYRSPRVSKEKGLGIGLYLAREIIEKQGGYIKVSSQTDRGSDFSVFLSKRSEICQNCNLWDRM